MFGYLKPYKPELKIKEYELYKAVYCSVCKCLSKNFGLLSKFTLSYDSTFLALLYFSLTDNCPSLKKGRCTVNPFKRCCFCEMQEKGIIFATTVCIIMTYYKILDDINDSKKVKKLLAYILLPIIKHSYKKAKKISPEIDAIILKAMTGQGIIERNNKPNIDKAAEPTAMMLSEIMGLLSLNEKQMRIVNEFSYFLGRWIYFIDATDDFYEDKKLGNFNPFIHKLSNTENNNEDNTKCYMKAVLNQTLSRVIAAYNLMDLNEFKPIMDNIIVIGLLNTQDKILEKEKNNGPI